MKYKKGKYGFYKTKGLRHVVYTGYRIGGGVK